MLLHFLVLLHGEYYQLVVDSEYCFAVGKVGSKAMPQFNYLVFNYYYYYYNTVPLALKPPLPFRIAEI